TPDAILVVSKGKVLFANPAAAALAGTSDAAMLLGRDAGEFIPFLANANRQQAAALQRRPVEACVLRVDGTTRDVELTSCPTTYDRQKASMVFLCDVTDRKRAERELRTSQERYRLVVESMNEALVVYDGEANIKY